MLTVNMVDAIKVQFLKPIFEDDYVEKGMKAWLTDVEWVENKECYKLYFDLSEFEDWNDKYFKESYYPNQHTRSIYHETGRARFTAKESHMYSPKYSVYFSISGSVRNDSRFKDEILAYLREIQE